MHYIYTRVCFTHAGKCRSRMVAMECGDLEGHLATNISSLFCEPALGRLRKYEGSWFFSNKSIYLAELTLKKVRAIKSSYRLSSDDAAPHPFIVLSACQ